MKQHLPRAVLWRLWIYRLLFPLALVFMLPAMIQRMRRRGGFRENLGERFGLFSADLQRRLAGRNPIWIQSISVGETMIALKLAREILATQPQAQILLSVTTSTGRELAEKAGLPLTAIVYNPVDLASVVRHVLAVVRPSRLIAVEGLWPVLVSECRRRDLPVALIARLSPRSELRYRRLRWLAAPILALLDPICVQDPDDIGRWQSLGAKSGSVHCTGAIKFDEAQSRPSRLPDLIAYLRQIGVPEGAQILLGGSTFPGEEAILARVFLRLRPKFPQLFLILVPRHFERTADILSELAPLQLRVALRTANSSGPSDLLLVNTTGELRDWYSLATIVFIGKSLTAIGGQNPVEAALAGKPLLFGPHMENFATVVKKWLTSNAVLQVQDEDELLIKVEELLSDSATRERLATLAQAAVADHQGATSRTVRLIFSRNPDESTNVAP